jgi:hypothetical protein
VPLHADGSAFTGLGIVPAAGDVALTAQAFHDGLDPELQAAVKVLGAH